MLMQPLSRVSDPMQTFSTSRMHIAFHYYGSKKPTNPQSMRELVMILTKKAWELLLLPSFVGSMLITIAINKAYFGSDGFMIPYPITFSIVHFPSSSNEGGLSDLYVSWVDLAYPMSVVCFKIFVFHIVGCGARRYFVMINPKTCPKKDLNMLSMSDLF